MKEKYLENWNEIIDLIEGLADDILDAIHCNNNDINVYRDITYSIAVYSLMLLKNYSQ